MFEFKCKDFYWLFVNKKREKSYAYNIWPSVLKDINWRNVWTILIKLMPVKKIAQFNYYKLYDKLPHNYNLFKWRIKDSPKCETCEKIQTMVHFLYDCKSVTPIWTKCNKIVNDIFKCNILLNWNHAIFGYQLWQKHFEMLNVFITLVSFAIYKGRLTCVSRIEKYLIQELTLMKNIYKGKQHEINKFIESL